MTFPRWALDAAGTDPNHGGRGPHGVELKTHKFVDELHGHEGTVLSMAFSRDAKKVVTACEDGKLRVFSVGDWKLRSKR